MTDNRFATCSMDIDPSTSTSGFFLLPIAAPEVASVSPMQWLYQQIYEQALRANQPPATRELFAIMN